MGEIADAVLDGLLDEETGELIDGEAPGYPRRMSQMRRIAEMPQSTKRGLRSKVIPCPACNKRFVTTFARDQHRTMKAH